ncbi:MAG: alpha/beta hydrolase [Oscillospiraceae bacterium]|nr:alpha/beta hydrolase [Oscillospiraceae bacterium]
MTVNIDNIETNYLCLGEESEEAVIMLHGWASNSELFRNSAISLSSKYYVLAPDMPGNGVTSEPPGAWFVDDYVQFVIHFIEHFGIKKVILLGHSFGGRVIIKMANRKALPFEIEKIILVDSAGIRPEKSNEQKMKESVSKFGKKLLSKTPALLDKMQSMVGSADYKAASPLMRQVLVNTVNEDLTPLLPGISQETLLIWGTLDTATPISDAVKMEELIPNAGLARMEGCGHFAFTQNPVLYNAILASFLNV